MNMLNCINDNYYFPITNYAAYGVRKNSYLINENGYIYSLITNRYLYPTLSNTGYYVINLQLENGSASTFLIHRLLMITFRYNINYKNLFVNHINGIKTDCRLNNMEWCTAKENTDHALLHGLICVGEDCSWAILTETQVKKIVELIATGTNITQIANKYNCSISTIGDIARGVTWKHLTNNMEFEYNVRQRFTEEQVRFMCQTFVQNKDKSFQYSYYLIIHFLNLPEDKFLRRRIYKIYKKDPNNFKYITSDYNY